MADSLSPEFDFDGGGVWTGVQDWPLIGIHATLTADNQLLTFGTDEQGMQGGQVFYDIWDYETDTHYTLPNPTGTDIFCSVSVVVPETGDILIVGGDARPLGKVNVGVKDVNVLDTETLELAPLPTTETGLTYARWYATAVTLSNGKILVLGGINEHNVGQGTPELYTPGGGFKTLDGAASSILASGWFYPRAWEASDGSVMIVADLGSGTMLRMDPSGDGSVEIYGDLPFRSGNNLPSVMYREDEILMMARDGKLWSVDFSGPSPVSQMVADLGAPRYFSNMTILANGDVAVIGGGSEGDVRELGTLYTEAVIWSPDSGTVVIGDGETEGRLYHSTSILLPDGSVLSLGGGAPGPFTQLNGEFYYPEMLFDSTTGERVVPIDIVEAPRIVEQRVSFQIVVDDPTSVARVTMVKSGSVTHTLNMETRFVEPDFTVDADTGVITIDPGDNSNVLTPGAWMVFVLDANGVPSEAATVMVGLGGERYMPELGTFVTLNGTAEVQAGTNEFLLTREESDAMGSVVSNRRIDFNHDFTLDVSLYLGARDAADGIAILFHNDPYTSDAVGLSGGELGVSGISNAFGIEFDTWNNNNAEISATHTGFITTTGGALTEVGTHTPLSSLEDGQWHGIIVTWDAATQTLSYSLDGVAMGSRTEDLASQYFDGTSAAFLAITAGTGGASNSQAARINQFTGFLENDAASLAGRYFIDADGNNVESTGEAGVSGATVWLYQNGTLIDSTVTEADGSYRFASVHAGDGFKVVFEDPNTALTSSGYLFADPDVGDEATDSDVVMTLASGDGETASFDLTKGELVSDVDAGTRANGNSPPVASDDLFPTLLASELVSSTGRALKINGTRITENDFDPDGDDIAITAVDGVLVTSSGWQGWRDASNGGQIVVNTDGRVQFRDTDGDFASLPLGDTVQTSITYTISDESGASAQATITVTIEGEAVAGGNVDPTPGDDINGPIAFSDLFGSNGSALKIKGANVLDNDTDPNGDALSIVAINGVAVTSGGWQGWKAASNGGEISLNTDGRVQFRDSDSDFADLPLGEQATTSLTYTVSDGNGGTADATISFIIDGEALTGPNVAPDAVDDLNGPLLVSELTDASGNAVKINGTNILANDSDANGDTVTIVDIGGTAVSGTGWQGWFDATNGGQIALNTDGRVVFRDTDFDFAGLAPGTSVDTTLTYTVTDGNSGFDTATIVFTIEAEDVLDFVAEEGDTIV